jgi:uncharacterized protein YaaQ
MKLITAIIRDSESESVSNALTSHEFRVTQIASSGGFLRRGLTTFLIGVDDEQVDTALRIIRETLLPATEANVKRATIFVLKVDHFTQF